MFAIGRIEEVNNHSYVGAISICGWALENRDGLRVSGALMIKTETGKVLSVAKPFLKRPDVAKAYHDESLETCGFEMFVEKRLLSDAKMLYLCYQEHPEVCFEKEVAVTEELRRYNPFPTLIMEPSSVCNALCSYCPTGYRNRLGKPMPKRYLTAREYRKKLDDLIGRGILRQDVFVNLYNWGEPFLAPEIAEMIGLLNERNLRYAISTNASVVKRFNGYGKDFLANLDTLIVSMPGFSQESYRRMHGFNAEKIKSNVSEMIENYRAAGFVGHARIALHQYRFNTAEWEEIYAFAKKLGMEVSPFCASLVSYDEYERYRQKKIAPERMRDIQTELFLDEIERVFAFRPAGFRCPQLDICTVDCFSQEVVLCCAMDPMVLRHDGAEVAQNSLEEVYDSKADSPICAKCAAMGYDYVCHHLPVVAVEDTRETVILGD